MWLLEFLYLAITLLLGWTMFGYLLVTWFVGLFRSRGVPALPDSWPFLSVVVPCYDEAPQIADKLENLRRLDYPRDRLEVIIADGGSTDGTVQSVTDALRGGEPIRLVRCPRGGKINQFNHVLPGLRGEIVINSDVDARLSPDALRWLAAEFSADPEVWVVGAYCRPADTLAVEHYYWSAQNKGRFLESDARTSSIVIAECYGFRRELLNAFPEDVVADDIYVAFLANTLGHRTVYSRLAMALSVRSPAGYSDFLPHKFRKSNAFLRESLRFLYRLPEMDNFSKLMLVTRTAQQLLLPWAMLFWGSLAGALLTLRQDDVVVFGAATLLALLAMTNRVFASVRLPEGADRHAALTVLKGYILTNLIMLATGLSYPFFRQGSSYSRLRTAAAGESGPGRSADEETAQPGQVAGAG